uniref:Uncharacterized protein n=1 Tax=Knipowitschia caucasica TaxID=637954 RepID=A0AAV2KE42_KNICA
MLTGSRFYEWVLVGVIDLTRRDPHKPGEPLLRKYRATCGISGPTTHCESTSSSEHLLSARSSGPPPQSTSSVLSSDHLLSPPSSDPPPQTILLNISSSGQPLSSILPQTTSSVHLSDSLLRALLRPPPQTPPQTSSSDHLISHLSDPLLRPPPLSTS